MIENRAKIEKKILLGRQAVRRSSRTRVSRGSLLEPRSLLLQPEQRSSDLSAPHQSPSPPQTGSDRPLSVDTDAEAAFARGSRWFFKRGRASTSNLRSFLKEDNSSLDPLTSSTIRRKWASDLLDDSRSGSMDRRISPVVDTGASQTEGGINVIPQGSFFSRLRNSSLTGLTSPFSRDYGTRSRRESSADYEAGSSWSSDSSSEELDRCRT
jgi:hypothetical protein